MVGIEETKEMLGFVIAIGNGAGATLEDGTIEPADAVFFVDALVKAPAAFKDMNLIPAEVSDITLEEMEELKAFVNENFDIPQDKVEVVIEKAINIGIQMYDLIKDIQEVI